MKKLTIGVIGYGGEDEHLNKTAYEVGRAIASKDCVLVCGGTGGVMRSACSGAVSLQGITVGILPGSDKDQANEYVNIPVITNMGEARNIIIVRSSDVLIAIGGGFGTLSEISFALKLDKTVVGLGTWDISDKIIRVSDPVEAVEKAYRIAISSAKNINY